MPRRAAQLAGALNGGDAHRRVGRWPARVQGLDNVAIRPIVPMGHVVAQASRDHVGPGREADSSDRQVPASAADHDGATPCQAILAGSRYHTIPADHRPTWAVAVMTRDRPEARLGGRDDGPDGEPGGRAACLARDLRMRRRSSAGAPTTADEALGRRGGPWSPAARWPRTTKRPFVPSRTAWAGAGARRRRRRRGRLQRGRHPMTTPPARTRPGCRQKGKRCHCNRPASRGGFAGGVPRGWADRSRR
jgi:hypothetical protein